MIQVRTPCRLHFGLLALDPARSRQFGGVGLMIEHPDIALELRLAEASHAQGPMADRALTFAQRFLQRAGARGLVAAPPPGVRVNVLRAPRPHTGLGTGTQLGMAVARGMASLLDCPPLPVAELAQLVGRGERSAIGAHGFAHGGLIVEGGKRHPHDLSPMLIRAECPESWRVVLVSPASLAGLAGKRERQAFAKMPPVPKQATAEMCRLVLLGLAPSMIEGDLATFGESLYQLQQIVGSCFAEAQGGIFAAPLLAEIVAYLRDQGIAGVGQSSWGPTLYAVVEDQLTAQGLAGALCARFGLSGDEVSVTRADNVGGSVEALAPHASEA